MTSSIIALVVIFPVLILAILLHMVYISTPRTVEENPQEIEMESIVRFVTRQYYRNKWGKYSMLINWTILDADDVEAGLAFRSGDSIPRSITPEPSISEILLGLPLPIYPATPPSTPTSYHFNVQHPPPAIINPIYHFPHLHVRYNPPS